MKNILEIDVLNNHSCSLITSIDDKTAKIFLNIMCDPSTNPTLEILGGEIILITSNQFLYELPNSLWVGNDILQFRIIENDVIGDYFSIAKIETYNETLSVKRLSDRNFKLSCKVPGSVDDHNHDNRYYTETEIDVQFANFDIKALTNLEIEEICK